MCRGPLGPESTGALPRACKRGFRGGVFLLLSRKAPLIHAQNGPSLKHLVLPLNCLQILFLFGSSQHSEEPRASSEEPLLLGAGVVWNLLPGICASSFHGACLAPRGPQPVPPARGSLRSVPEGFVGCLGTLFKLGGTWRVLQKLSFWKQETAPCYALSFPRSGGDTEAGVCSASPGRKYAESGAGRPAPRSLSQHFRPRSAPVTVSSCAGFLVGAHLAPW